MLLIWKYCNAQLNNNSIAFCELFFEWTSDVIFFRERIFRSMYNYIFSYFTIKLLVLQKKGINGDATDYTIVDRILGNPKF